MVNKMKKILAILGMLILVCGCIDDRNIEKSTITIEQDLTEKNQKVLALTQPAPTITKSLERENLIKRMGLINDNGKTFYIYLINFGKVMAFYTTNGKITSLNAYLTAETKFIRDDDCYSKCSGVESCSVCWYVSESPDLDGAYGKNDDGVFFFTTEGAYVEWKGDYMVSDQPLKLSQPPELIMDITDKKD